MQWVRPQKEKKNEECTNWTNEVLIWRKRVTMKESSPKVIFLGLSNCGSNSGLHIFTDPNTEDPKDTGQKIKLSVCNLADLRKPTRLAPPPRHYIDRQPRYWVTDRLITCTYCVRVLENYFSDKVFGHISFLSKKQKNISNSLSPVVWLWTQNTCHCRKQLHCEQSSLKFARLESAVSIMVIDPFLGQGPFRLHVLSLGNKGQWMVLESGQMAGFFPVSRLLDPRRLPPGGPAAWLSGRLLDDLVTPASQRWACICALSFQSGKNGDTSSAFASQLKRNLVLLTKCCLAGVGISLCNPNGQDSLPDFQKKTWPLSRPTLTWFGAEICFLLFPAQCLFKGKWCLEGLFLP